MSRKTEPSAKDALETVQYELYGSWTRPSTGGGSGNAPDADAALFDAVRWYQNVAALSASAHACADPLTRAALLLSAELERRARVKRAANPVWAKGWAVYGPVDYHEPTQTLIIRKEANHPEEPTATPEIIAVRDDGACFFRDHGARRPDFLARSIGPPRRCDPSLN
jgi:hypothetical protein